MQKFLLIFSLLWILSLNKTFAFHCGGEANVDAHSGSPNLTISADTLEQGSFVLGAGIQYSNFHEFSKSDMQNFAKTGLHRHNYKSTMSTFISGSYGLTDDFEITLTYPFNFQFGTSSSSPEGFVDEGNSIGFGDLRLLGKYRFLEIEDLDFHASLLGGIKMPTGSTNEEDSFGAVLGINDQPGTGSWDPMMGFALTKIVGNWSFDFNSLYILSTEGENKNIVGDQLNYNFAVSFLIPNCKKDLLNKIFPDKIFGHSSDWTLSLEMNGLWSEKPEFNGIKNDNHGGGVIFLSPGIKVAIDKSLIADLSVALPIIQDLNGEQPDQGLMLLFEVHKIF